SITLNIKLGLIEDDIIDKSEFYGEMYRHITSKYLLRDEKGEPIPMDEKGERRLTKKELKTIPPEEVSYKVTDIQKYNEDLFELKTYPVDASHITENLTLQDIANLEDLNIDKN